MDIGKTLGGIAGTVIGTVIGGPIGTAVGPAVGAGVGDAIEGAIEGAFQPDPTPPVAPAPKPLIQSKTAWFGLLVAVAPAALQWGVDYDWTQTVSPTAAAVIVGVLTIGLRLVSTGAIGRG